MKKIILRIKTFLYVGLLTILLFVGIFIPPVHKILNEAVLETMRKLVKKYEKVKCFFGMDIATDTRIPKGTLAFGFKKDDGSIEITEFVKVPEEKNTLSDEISVAENFVAGTKIIPVEKIEKKLKEFIEHISTIKPTDLNEYGKLNYLHNTAKEIFGDRLI